VTQAFAWVTLGRGGGDGWGFDAPRYLSEALLRQGESRQELRLHRS